MADLPSIALRLPDVERGVACAGTALESATFSTRGKAFLFVSAKAARLKLGDDSAADARRRGFPVGKNGWVTMPLDALPAANVVKAWIAESYAAIGDDKPAAKRRVPLRPQRASRRH